MKMLGTTYKEISIKEIVCLAEPGSTVYAAVAEGVQLACQLMVPVVVVHNDKRYPISVAKILEGISPEEGKKKC